MKTSYIFSKELEQICDTVRLCKMILTALKLLKGETFDVKGVKVFHATLRSKMRSKPVHSPEGSA